MIPITYRPGTLADAYTTFCLFEETFADLSARMGLGATSWPDREALAAMWERRRPLYEYLSQAADLFYMAEADGQAVGFARSIVRGDVRQLTEFFVRPSAQSGGVGGELLARAFPNDEIPFKSIIATTDLRAQARYLKAGLYPRFPIYYFWRKPQATAVPTDLVFKRLVATPETLAALAEIDQAVLGFCRRADQEWMMQQRQGMGYWRDGRLVGYGYLGRSNGPFALLDAADFPAVLAHAESTAAAAGYDHFGMEAPLCNVTAVNHLLARGCQIDGFIALFMCNRPFGKLENYIIHAPPYFL